jgi:hypothetical protein
MIGIIECDNISFLYQLKNNKILLRYWYEKLKQICVKIFILIKDEYKGCIFLNETDVFVINDKNVIKNEYYDLMLVVKGTNIIDRIDIDIIKNINNNGIVYWNKIAGAWIFKKENENIYINNEIDKYEKFFVKKEICGLLWDANNLEDYNKYLNFLSIPKRTYVNGTLIIVALYIGDIEKDKINTSINCLKDLRKYFEKEMIVIVDNNSYNNDWIDVAISLNMYIIKNTSDLYRFEIGAYNLALKYFEADRYICIQHNIQFHKKLDYELSEDRPDAYVFKTITYLDWSSYGLKLINKYLSYLKMDSWNNEPLAIWNSFYCNNLMMNEIIKSGLLNVISNDKDISQAYERIIGLFIFRKMGYINVINDTLFHKNFFIQL